MTRPTHPSDLVVTTRGTDSTAEYSFGNTVPAAAVPNGFNLWFPVTDAAALDWPYRYRPDTDENPPALEGFRLSHSPSPWIGDRQTFQFMPSASEAPVAEPTARACRFRRASEVAKPHRYAVRFEEGTTVEIAPTDHAALIRMSFASRTGHLILDDPGDIVVDPAGRSIQAHSDIRSPLSSGAPRLFVWAEVDTPITAWRQERTGPGSSVTFLTFDLRRGPEVVLRVATSFISVDQAKRNLEREISPTDTTWSVARRAQQSWDALLGSVEVDGASGDELVTLYSNLYRMFLYPTSAFEDLGTGTTPDHRHVVPRDGPAAGMPGTGSDVALRDGRMYVNHGFWDTYRTVWPAYALLAPDLAGTVIDGFLQHYRDTGWIPRWSAPGAVDLMVGTNSDAAFADSYLKGVRGFDPHAAYEAGSGSSMSGWSSA